METLKPLVDSWDVFDTLLTRFVIDPLRVFDLIGRRHPEMDFVGRRLRAQAALDRIGKPYVIYEIYRQMVEAGLDPVMANALLGEELACEQAMLLPIRRAVERVKPDDLLISDMYLPAEIIAGMLAETCDLRGAAVIRSNWGKRSGTLWRMLQRHYVIRTHHGDHPIADGEVPRGFHIRTLLLRDTEPTAWEKSVTETGQPRLALILRETRLRSLQADAGVFENLATGPYPTLLLSFSRHLAERYGEAASFAFLSRDCDELGRVFRAVFPATQAADIDLSRRLSRDPAHDSVFDLLLPPAGGVLVDGVSTGRSVASLLGRIGGGRIFTTLLFLDHLLDAPAIAGSAEFLFKSSDFGGQHYPLELLLQAPYPPVLGIALDTASGGVVKTYGRRDLLPAEARMIGTKFAIIGNFVASLRRRGLPPPPSPAQNHALLRASLEAILAAELHPPAFPSFHARERFIS